MTPASSPTYRPDIDGMRAVAVLSVLFFHAGLTPFSGGFVGVDVFFVISGFLITGIVQGEITKGSFTVAGFYERRIRRIFPALLFTIALTVAGAVVLFSATELERLFESLAWLAIFASNIYFMNNSGYFDAAAEENAILQTWSLAIEEQFYVVFPLLLLALNKQKFASPRNVLAAVAGLSLAYSIFIVDRDARTAFFSTPGRAWELLLGSLIALGALPALTDERVRNAVAALGALAIAASIVLLTHDTPFPGLYAVPACAGTAAVIWANSHGTTFVGRGLSQPAVVLIGLVSYSLYLLHWPLLTFAKYAKQDELLLAEALGVLAVAFALALISWRYVETPLRRPKTRAPQRAVLAAGASTVFVLAAGAFAAAAWWAGEHSLADQQTERERQRMLAEPCMLRDTQTFAEWPAEQCTIRGGDEVVAVWGDSFAAHYFDAFRADAKRRGHSLMLLAESSCPPIPNLPVPNRPGCERFNQGALAHLLAQRPSVLIVSADWMIYEKKKSVSESFVGKFELLSQTLTKLDQAGIRIIVIGPTPVFAAPVPRIAASDATDRAKASYSRLFDDFFAELKSAGTIDYIPAYKAFCNAAAYCSFREGGELLFWDNGHLTARGSDRVVSMVRTSLAPAP